MSLACKVLQIQCGILSWRSSGQVICEFGFTPEIVNMRSQLSYSRSQRKWSFVDQFFPPWKLWTAAQRSTRCEGRSLLWSQFIRSLLGPQSFDAKGCGTQRFLFHVGEIVFLCLVLLRFRLSLLLCHVIFQLLGCRTIIFPSGTTFSCWSQLHGFQMFHLFISSTSTMNRRFNRCLALEKCKRSRWITWSMPWHVWHVHAIEASHGNAWAFWMLQRTQKTSKSTGIPQVGDWIPCHGDSAFVCHVLMFLEFSRVEKTTLPCWVSGHCLELRASLSISAAKILLFFFKGTHPSVSGNDSSWWHKFGIHQLIQIKGWIWFYDILWILLVKSSENQMGKFHSWQCGGVASIHYHDLLSSLHSTQSQVMCHDLRWSIHEKLKQFGCNSHLVSSWFMIFICKSDKRSQHSTEMFRFDTWSLQTYSSIRRPSNSGCWAITVRWQFLVFDHCAWQVHGCFLKWWYLYRHFTPQVLIIFSRKTHGFVGETPF